MVAGSLAHTVAMKPSALPSAIRAASPEEEALALRFLEARRGRRIQQPPPTVARLLERRLETDPKAARRAGAALATIKLRWPEIAGEKLARLCQPEAVRKDTLVLRTTSAAAPLLQMRATEILGLVALAGGPPLKKLSLVRAPLSAIGTPPPRRAPRPLPAARAAELERKLETVAAARLKEAVRALATLAGQD